MCEFQVIEAIKNMYIEYGVDVAVVENMTDEQIIKGMKGVLAQLDINKKKEYSEEHKFFIKKVYARFC